VSGGTSLHILNVGIRWSCVVSFTPRPLSPPPPVPVGWEAGLAPEPVWTRWQWKSDFPWWGPHPSSPARSLIIVLTTLPASYTIKKEKNTYLMLLIYLGRLLHERQDELVYGMIENRWQMMAWN